MDNVTLCKKLRQIAGGASPYKRQLLRQAARRIGELSAFVGEIRQHQEALRRVVGFVGEAPAMDLYGDYVVADRQQVAEAKNLLLEQMFNMIEELAKNEEFWIVKPAQGEDPEKRTVGYKIAVPKMKKEAEDCVNG